MQITKQDPFTGSQNTLDIDVTQEQIDKWTSGTLIQNAMPHLSADHREFLMTGITPHSWDKFLGAPDD